MYNIIVRETSSEIRAIARSSLKGCWPQVAIGVFLYYVMTTTIPVLLGYLMPFASYQYYNELFGQSISLSYVARLYNLVLTGAFELGLCSFMIGFFRRRESNPAGIFNGFESFPKAFCLFIVQNFFIALWTLLLIVPGIIAAIRYSQAFYVLADNPDKGIMECIEDSKRMMNGNKGKFFCLILSFIGWTILSALPSAFLPVSPGIVGEIIDLVYSIPVFFMLTYLYVARVVFYDLASGHLVAKSEPAPEDNYYF